MISNPDNEKDRIMVKVDRKEYEKEGVLFDQMKNPVSTGPKKDEKDHGLDNWTSTIFSKLRKEIGTLVLPKELADTRT